ncbi:hypothetical protein JKY72_04405, partial [Candidatus Gracilibacteria bacterium]|nr:hypothetical protein [Candidatus Gracilibacteria bacterium]
GLGYPGGPAIQKIAVKGDREKYKLPRAMMGKESLEFSFSGLKTSVLDKVRAGDVDVADMAASFQEAVVDALVKKVLRALAQYPEIREVHLAGGVSANLRLREVLGEALDVKFLYPELISYCTDNAAMIAASAYFAYEKNPENYSKMSNITPNSAFSLGISGKYARLHSC